MIRTKIRFLFVVLFVITVFLSLTGGDCTANTDDNTLTVVGKPATPTNVTVSLSAAPGGSSSAVISWTSSSNENGTEFRGYRVSTFLVDSTGVLDSMLITDMLSKTQHSYTITDIPTGIKLKTYVSGEFVEGTKGDSAATPVYAGIYYNNDGSIDEYMPSGPAESGYGWDVVKGPGTQYNYNEVNAPLIDLHLRSDSSNALIFYSPNLVPPGTKTTLMTRVDTNAAAFNLTNLNEPDLTSIPVAVGSVYLLKTNQGNYVKIWVKAIDTVAVIPPYRSVQFEYKVQPIAGLRVL